MRVTELFNKVNMAGIVTATERLKYLCALLLTFAVVFSVSSPVFAGKQDFTLVNRTGRTIYYVFCSGVSARYWEEDILGSDVLYDGSSVNITFPASQTDRYWDLKVVFNSNRNSNDYWYWTNIDLFTYGRLTIDPSGTLYKN